MTRSGLRPRLPGKSPDNSVSDAMRWMGNKCLDGLAISFVAMPMRDGEQRLSIPGGICRTDKRRGRLDSGKWSD